MKILHVDTGREMRGGQWQVLRLHRALLEAGHESVLLAREGGPLLKKADACEALRPLRFPLKSRGFDLVHAHDARSHSLAALWSRVPFVVSRRVAFPLKTSAVSRWKYRRARRYLAVSRYVAGVLTQAGIDASRVDIVYDGVDIPETSAHGDKIIAPYTEDAAKGMALAEAAARLAQLPLILSKDLEHDLPHARALLYLTQSEGLGSGILLSMAYGVPVIASDVGGIPELIENGVNGVLVQNESNSVAAALRGLNASLCAELGRAARETVRNRFTVEHMLQNTLDAYRRALND